MSDAYDPASCASAVHAAAADPGGPDAVVTAFGPAASRRALEAGDKAGDNVAEYPMAVDVLAPAAFLHAALGIMRPGSVLAAFTGVVAERRHAGTAPPVSAGGGPHQLVGAVADAMEVDAELLRTAPDGTPVVERRAG